MSWKESPVCVLGDRRARASKDARTKEKKKRARATRHNVTAFATTANHKPVPASTLFLLCQVHGLGARIRLRASMLGCRESDKTHSVVTFFVTAQQNNGRAGLSCCLCIFFSCDPLFYSICPLCHNPLLFFYCFIETR